MTCSASHRCLSRNTQTWNRNVQLWIVLFILLSLVKIQFSFDDSMSESRTAWNHTAWESHVIMSFALASWPPRPYICSVLRSHSSLALNVPRTPKNLPTTRLSSVHLCTLGYYRSYRSVPISAVSRLPNAQRRTPHTRTENVFQNVGCTDR